LAEAFGNGLRVIGVDLVALGVFVVSAQVGMIENDPAPSLQQLIDLISQHVLRQTQIDHVLLREQRGFLQLLPFLHRDG
jgi:2-keto-3-deoxy-L-rhamnonate aldolase RhmA